MTPKNTITYDANNPQDWRVDYTENYEDFCIASDTAATIIRNNFNTFCAAPLSLGIGTIFATLGLTSLINTDSPTTGTVLIGLGAIIMTISMILYLNLFIKKKRRNYQELAVSYRGVQIVKTNKEIQTSYLQNKDGKYNNDYDKKDAEELDNQVSAVLIRGRESEIYQYLNVIQDLRTEYKNRSVRRRQESMMDDPVDAGKKLLSERRLSMSLESGI